eukprot:TRINITY_DN647_c0_g1_i2.p1 TRINITY_DN647_c0_g1~~TRINITY_DN647_c0_g1_i2.p1  ORF type:complete len:119 (+),score=18.46 TRINITY_DN647_c0_g1_i2:33-359(+)
MKAVDSCILLPHKFKLKAIHSDHVDVSIKTKSLKKLLLLAYIDYNLRSDEDKEDSLWVYLHSEARLSLRPKLSKNRISNKSCIHIDLETLPQFALLSRDLIGSRRVRF